MRDGGGRKAALARTWPEPVTLTCEVCGKEWTDRPSQASRRRTCSVRCASELKRKQHRGRTGERNPNWRGGRRSGVRDRAGERRWYAAMGRVCAHPACRRGGFDLALHHIVYRQAIVPAGGDLWDPRNALTLCAGCHSSHHRRGSRVVPLAVLPDSAFDFAGETLGAGAAYEYLKRRYAGEDPRLEALLDRDYGERRAA